jgi:hypothetical protein
MNIDITPYIKELLFEHNNLVIPGFGALTLEYAPSTIDHVQGLLNPPTKSITFDDNLVVNDGKLVSIIQKKHQVSTEEAKEQIKKFVNITKDQLNRREMVNIAGVGRLYKNFENQLQFIPDSTNFNKESFGLPTVNFFPILKEVTTIDNIVPSGSINKAKKAKAKTSFADKVKAFFEENTWAPIGFVTTALILISFFLFKDYLFNNQSALADLKINESPKKEAVIQETAIATDEASTEDEDAADYEEDQNEMELPDEKVIDTEQITANPNQRVALVSVGVFGNKANAQKRIKQVYEYGFDVLPEKYRKNGKELTKVGIQFAFETEEEFQSTLKSIKKRFSNAVVIKKE